MPMQNADEIDQPSEHSWCLVTFRIVRLMVEIPHLDQNLNIDTLEEYIFILTIRDLNYAGGG